MGVVKRRTGRTLPRLFDTGTSATETTKSGPDVGEVITHTTGSVL
jgi:hypothetical protein